MPAGLFNDSEVSWHRGRIIVIGYAAHTARPHLASGASIAIEDSIVLARLFQSERSLNAVLDFMHQRYERCRDRGKLAASTRSGHSR
jgi:2-polyprenyl-6-methoxyphenol hydroxylase-like FAD-dependent oxidoreductase